MFDLKTFKVLGRIPAAEDADAIIYDSASKRVFTLNGDAHSSTVIDPRAGTVITNIPLGGKPEYGASAGDGKVYANLTDNSEIVEIDAQDRDRDTALVHRAVQAAGLDGDRHCAPSAVQRMPQRPDGDLRLRSRQSGGYRPHRKPAWTALGYDADSGNAFASNADGTLTVIHQDTPDQYHVIEQVQTPPGSRNMGLDPAQPQGVRGFREVWPGSGRFRQGQAAGVARIIRIDGDRTRSCGALSQIAEIECNIAVTSSRAAHCAAWAARTATTSIFGTSSAAKAWRAWR